jgi:hypothetical protein
MNEGQTWKVRLVAFGAAVLCLALAFALVTEMPLIMLLIGLAVTFGVPLILFSLGWLGVWLLTFGGLWGGSMLLFLADPTVGMRDFVLMCLILAGLTGLGIAVVPPHVAAKHRAAWPFGYLKPKQDVEKAKRERLLLEEEITYERVPAQWEDEDEEEIEHVMAFPKRKSSVR